MNFQWINKVWEIVNRISPHTRSVLIIIMFGYILYSQLSLSIREQISERFQEEILHTKKAEQYSKETSVEICRYVQVIADKDDDAFNVLLLSYHNNTQSLQGYQYLYLTCITEAPKTLDTPLLKQQWNRIDYVYYADELSRIHNQSFVYIENLEQLKKFFPKLYRLVKASDAQSIAFFAIEGQDSAVGMVVVLYDKPKCFDSNYDRKILPYIQKLAIMLDYEHIKK